MDKLAEEILFRYRLKAGGMTEADMIEAMQAYHEAKMKEELTRFMLCLTIDKYQDNKDADIIKEYMDIYFGESAHNETK